MYVGFNESREFRTGDIRTALARQVPLSVSQRETIGALRSWLLTDTTRCAPRKLGMNSVGNLALPAPTGVVTGGVPLVS
jgi:hypothetical protein